MTIIVFTINILIINLDFKANIFMHLIILNHTVNYSFTFTSLRIKIRFQSHMN